MEEKTRITTNENGEEIAEKLSDKELLEKIDEAKEVPDQTEAIKEATQRAADDLRNHSHKGIDTARIHSNDVVRDNDTRIRAYSASGQTVGATPEIMEMDTETYDTRGEFDTSAYRFTVTKEGYYSIYAQIYYQSVVDDQTITVYIYKNGAAVARGQYALGGAAGAKHVVVNVNDTIKLNKDDYIEIYGASPSLSSGGGTSSTFLTITKLF